MLKGRASFNLGTFGALLLGVGVLALVLGEGAPAGASGATASPRIAANPYPGGSPPMPPANLLDDPAEALDSASARAERARSATAFSGVERHEAIALLEGTFPSQLSALDRDLASRFDEFDVRKYLGDGIAQVDPPGPDDRGLAISTLPLRDESDEGVKRPIDLGLEREGSGYEASNPLVDVRLPLESDEPALLSEAGVGVQIGSPSADSPARRIDGGALFYHDIDVDTDAVITPVMSGFEILSQVRSAVAPERLPLHLRLPEGVSARTKGAGVDFVRDGESVATVDTPAAIDAQGQAVATRLEIGSEGRLDLVTEHRGAGVAYPVLVDPTVQESWSWYYPNSYVGMGHWPVNPWSGYFAAATVPWWNGANLGTPGLYFHAPAQWNFPAGAWMERSYTVPGATSYISSAVYDIYWHRLSDPTGSPHTYMGLHGTAGWAAGQPHYLTTQPYYYNTWGFTGGPGIQRAVLGMAMSYPGRKPLYTRSIKLNGAVLTLNDAEAPMVQTPPAAQIPTDWVDTDVVTVTTAATDPGLGIHKVDLVLPVIGGDQVVSKSEACTGTKTGVLCPAGNHDPTAGDAHETDTFTFDTDNLHEGAQAIKIRASDPVGGPAHAGEKTFRLWVDHSGPKLRSISGSLAEAAGQQLVLPSYDLHVKARDGWTAIPSSGVRSIAVLVDGEQVTDEEQECPQDSCPMSLDWTLEPETLPSGPHTIRVVATDQLGHETDHLVAGVVVPEPEVIHGTQYDGPPSGGGKVIREEWIIPGSNVNRVKTPDNVSVNASVPCDPDEPEGEECDQLLSATKRPAPNEVVPEEGFYAETGVTEDDIQVANPSMLLGIAAAAAARTPTSTGPISQVLQGWQTPPPLGGAIFSYYETSKTYLGSPGTPDTGDDHSPTYVTETDRLWVESRTQLPIRSQHSITGGPTSNSYWTYEHLLDTEVPTDLFELEPRPGTTEYESIVHHGAEGMNDEESLAGEMLMAAGASSEAETEEDGFSALYLGASPLIGQGDGSSVVQSLVGQSSAGSSGEPEYCFSGFDEVLFVDETNEHVEGEDPEDPDYVEPDPSGDVYYYSANYEELEGECEPGMTDGQGPDLDVVSAPPDSPLAEAMTDQYVDEASPDGIEPVTVLGEEEEAFVTEAAGETSALIGLEQATVMITGEFEQADIEEIAALLQEQ